MGGNNKGLYLILVLSAIAFSVDLYTTLSLGSLVQYLESNPLYSKFGIWGIVLFNFLLYWGLYFAYSRSKNFRNRFIMMNMMVTILFMRGVVAYNNFLISKNPPTVELARQVTVEMKRQVVAKVVGVSLLPFIIGLVTFYIYVIDHSCRIKGDKNE